MKSINENTKLAPGEACPPVLKFSKPKFMKTNKHILSKTKLLNHIIECISTPHLCNFIYGEKAFKIAQMYYDKFYNNVENDNTNLKEWVLEISKREDFSNDFKFIDSEICKQLI